MPKLLTQHEMELLRVAILWRRRYEMSTRRIGPGPTIDMLADDLVQRLSFPVDEDDLAECCEAVFRQVDE